MLKTSDSASIGQLVAFIYLAAFLLYQGRGNKIRSLEVAEKGHSKKCDDLYKGSWVLDNSYPLYDPLSCPILIPSLNCQKNGRPDDLYAQYRWKPLSCNLPRFNGKSFLQKFRGKRIVFVGDSFSSNQWQSLACMLHSAVPHSNFTIHSTRSLIKLSFPEYKVSTMFLQNGFLVDRESKAGFGRVLNLDSITKTAYWKTADILIFNSYHWWTHTGIHQTWDYFQVGDKISKDMDRMEAYRIALTTWSRWVDSNIDFTKTAVFFQGISAYHNHGTQWGQPGVESCKGQTEPTNSTEYPGQRYPGEKVVKSVLRKIKNHVSLLDITLLTQLRKDGHPSKYAIRSADCSHWCLAGVPDTWNELLYAKLLRYPSRPYYNGDF